MTRSGAYVIDLVYLIGALFPGFILDAFLDRYYYGLPFGQLALYTPLMAGAVGFSTNWFRRRRTGMFVWVMPLLLFIGAAADLYASWEPAWAGATRWNYVANGLFGPHCQSEECIYTLPTDVFLASVLYSIGTGCAFFLKERLDRS